VHKLEQIQKELAQLEHDLRAEVVVSQVLYHTGQALPHVVHTDDFFLRRFSRDITRIEMDDVTDIKELLRIHLSRTGLYDLLPEGLFFKPDATGRKPRTAAEMAEEYKQNQQQEQEVRKFFLPLENEFFHYRQKNFAAEAALLNGLHNEAVNRYFVALWQLPGDMQPMMALRLILLLPYVHAITGNTELMAASLDAILGERVNCQRQTQPEQYTGLPYNLLGDLELGNGLTCGDSYAEECFELVFTVYDLTHSQAQDYLPGGRLYSTLQAFYRFFVPAMAMVQTNIRVRASKESMHLGTGEEAVLGIATVL
jgi:hypothetical protein